MAINGGVAVPPELAVNVERYAVYRCYADDGQLLYVGETGDLGTRFASHAQKLWFTQVCGITLEWYLDELDALNAERRAIHVEHPKYNVIHRSAVKLAPSRRPAPARRAAARKAAPGKRTTRADAQAEALSILAAEPDISGAQLGLRVNKSKRWGQDFKGQLATRTAEGGGAPS